MACILVKYLTYSNIHCAEGHKENRRANRPDSNRQASRDAQANGLRARSPAGNIDELSVQTWHLENRQMRMCIVYMFRFRAQIASREPAYGSYICAYRACTYTGPEVYIDCEP